jgi:protein-glucosylgalactosylhydroxylysine glucosidase
VEGDDVSEIISPEPVTEWHPGDLPPYLSNGLIGLRPGTHPLANGVTVVSGLVAVDPTDGIPTFAQAPYPLALDIVVNRVSMASAPQCCVLREQRYDFSCGEVETRFGFSVNGIKGEVSGLVFCSRVLPTLVFEELTVRVDQDCDLGISATVDTRSVDGNLLSLQMNMSALPGMGAVDGTLHWGMFGGLSSCGVAYATELAGARDVTRKTSRGRTGPMSTMYSFHAEVGRTYRLRRIVCLLPVTMHSQPDLQAVRMLHAGQLRGFDELRQANRDEWGRIWEGRIMLAGAPSRWQRLVDAAYFYVHTSVHMSAPSSTSIFGLAYWPNYHYYRGHVMWDIDTFVIPPLMLTNPDIVRGLLSFRHDHMSAARANAQMYGVPGLKYPWEASPINGDEATPLSAAAPAVEHHVSMDVALAFARFVHATGDHKFAVEQAWPVLSGVSNWITGRVEPSERGYEIRRVNGPAETDQIVNNNAFVNMGAILTLRHAAALGRELGLGDPDRWEAVADRIVLPMDPQRGIIVNHDGYQPDEFKGETPEAPAGFFPLGYQAGPELERRTLDYFLTRADEYAGAPMLSAMLGVYAAWTGDRAAALDKFERGYAEFIVEPYTITAEYSPKVFVGRPIAGPFAANTGGFLSACLYGLPGIHLKPSAPSSWCERPVVLPQGWDAIHVNRVWVRGEPMHLVAEQGAPRARLINHSPLGGDLPG